MAKRIRIIVSIIVLVVFGWFIFLHFVNDQKNGFLRTFLRVPPINLVKMTGDNTAYKINGISGVTAGTIFFRTDHPDQLVSLDIDKRIIATHHIADTAFFSNTAVGNFCITGDSNFIYIFKINCPKYLSVDISKKQCREHYIPSFAFTRCACIKPGNFVFRRYDDNLHDQIFSKVNSIIKDENELSEVHHDWGMGTDGMLLKNDGTAQFVYLYYKKNSYLVFDSTLHLISRGKTIDTFTSRRSQIKRIPAKKQKWGIVTEDGPATISNISACIYKGLLYVNSRLRADNEIKENIEEYSSIDIYRLKDAKYLGSFYIPRYKGKQIRSLFIYKSTLVGIYPSALRIYNFKPPVQ